MIKLIFSTKGAGLSFLDLSGSIEAYRLTRNDFKLKEKKLESKRDNKSYIQFEFTNLDKFKVFQSFQYSILPYLGDTASHLVTNCKTIKFIESNNVFYLTKILGVNKPKLIYDVYSDIKKTLEHYKKNKDEINHCNFYRFCIYCSILSSINTAIYLFDDWKQVFKKGLYPCIFFVLYDLKVEKDKIHKFLTDIIKILALEENTYSIISLFPNLERNSREDKYFYFNLVYLTQEIQLINYDKINYNEIVWKLIIEFEDLIDKIKNFVTYKGLKESLEDIYLERNYEIYSVKIQDFFDWVEFNFILHMPVRLNEKLVKRTDFYHLLFSQLFFSTPNLSLIH